MADAPAHAITRRTIEGDGLPLAVWEGRRNGPTVVLVHGYPDTHVVWNRVVERLAGDFHCVVYDVRGAGESGVPAARAGYLLEHLRADLVAVLDAVAPTEPVHLVGHDWGSIQAWDAVVRASSDPALSGRITSYTTISGPCLEHVHEPGFVRIDPADGVGRLAGHPDRPIWSECRLHRVAVQGHVFLRRAVGRAQP